MASAPCMGAVSPSWVRTSCGDRYLPDDVVPDLREVILGDPTELPDIVTTVLHDTNLLDGPLRPLHLTWNVASRASR